MSLKEVIKKMAKYEPGQRGRPRKEEYEDEEEGYNPVNPQPVPIPTPIQPKAPETPKEIRTVVYTDALLIELHLKLDRLEFLTREGFRRFGVELPSQEELK